MSSDKETAVLNLIRADILGCDLKLSLFVSSQLYTYESCCVPFPPQFLRNGEKQITELTQLINTISDFDCLLSGAAKLSSDAIDLLHWLFIELHGPQLETIPKVEFTNILAKSKQEQTPPMPTHIFRVCYREGSSLEARFQEHAREFFTAFAFHGTKVQNFHNILHHNLQQHLNKTSLFGEGLYLSTEMNVSLPYSTNGSGWKNSLLGTRMAAVALCEYVDHPVSVKKCTKESARKTDLPEKYLIIQNNDIVRVRYLVVYASGRKKQEEAQGLLGLMCSHKALFVVYFLVLVAIGCSDSRYLNYLKQKFYQQMANGLEELRILFGSG